MMKMTNSKTTTVNVLIRILGMLIASLINFDLIQVCSAISCYDCRAEDISCNVGECIGGTCVKLETSYIDNYRKTVEKGCSKDYEDNECKQTNLGRKVVLRCTCDSNFCNGDRNLVAAGLQQMADDGARGVAKSGLAIGGLALFSLIVIIMLLHIILAR